MSWLCEVVPRTSVLGDPVLRTACYVNSHKKPVLRHLHTEMPLDTDVSGHTLLSPRQVEMSFGFHTLLSFRKKQQNINQETSQLLDPEWGLGKEGKAVQFYTHQCTCLS